MEDSNTIEVKHVVLHSPLFIAGWGACKDTLYKGAKRELSDLKMTYTNGMLTATANKITVLLPSSSILLMIKA